MTPLGRHRAAASKTLAAATALRFESSHASGTWQPADASAPCGDMSASPNQRKGAGDALAPLGCHAQGAARAKGSRLADKSLAVAEREAYATVVAEGAEPFQKLAKNQARPTMTHRITMGERTDATSRRYSLCRGDLTLRQG